MELKKVIRSVADFPKQGILFYDVTTLFLDVEAMKFALNELYDYAKDLGVTKVAGIESRGFIFGAALAEKLEAGFVPIRKPGKLPAEKISESYELEYGSDTIEMHTDAISKGDKVLLHDDLLATGGTAEAAVKLIEKAGGEVVQISFIIELLFLKGANKLNGYEIKSLMKYED